MMEIRKIYMTYHFGCSFNRQLLQDRVDQNKPVVNWSNPSTNKHGYAPPQPEEIREGYALVSDDGLVFYLNQATTFIKED
jgi:hypothetical protein